MGMQLLPASLLHLLFPQLCAGCQDPLVTDEVLLCLSCQQEIPRCHFHEDRNNAAAMRLAGRIPFQYATSFAYFVQNGLLQYLLHRLKYQGQKSIGRQLGTLFAWDLEEAGWLRSVDMILPVPLHVRKERKRGYNQAALISGNMAEVLGKQDGAAFLTRIRFTESQTKKTREQRVENVSGAFAVRHPQKLTGKHILIVDDVLTTGATLEAAAAALLTVPKVTVSFATIALAGL